MTATPTPLRELLQQIADEPSDPPFNSAQNRQIERMRQRAMEAIAILSARDEAGASFDVELVADMLRRYSAIVTSDGFDAAGHYTENCIGDQIDALESSEAGAETVALATPPAASPALLELAGLLQGWQAALKTGFTLTPESCAMQLEDAIRRLAAVAPAGMDGAALNGARPLPADRDTLGRFVREAWVRWAQQQPNPKPSWLVPYGELPEADKEADRQIGEAVARWTLILDAARLAAPTPPATAGKEPQDALITFRAPPVFLLPEERTHKLVPLIPTEEQWGGLARDIVTWWTFERCTGRALFRHLDNCGTPIPDWLREEVPDVDHVPPKGTVAAIIYRAMVEAAP